MPVFQKNYDFFKKSLDKPLSVVYNVTVIWVWRRLVARYLGVVEAAGSSPVTQTKRKTVTVGGCFSFGLNEAHLTVHE